MRELQEVLRHHGMWLLGTVGVAATLVALLDPGILVGGLATAAAALLLLCAALLLRLHDVHKSVRGPAGVKYVHTSLDDVPWSELVSAARTIEIVARFFDGPLSQAEKELREFFREGGRLTITIPDLDDQEVMNLIATQRDQTPNKYRSDPADRIRRGLRIAVHACNKATGSTDRIEVYVLSFAPNYAGYCFDDRTLLLSPYEHNFDVTRRAPRLDIDLDQSPAFRDFWQQERRVNKGHRDSMTIDQRIGIA